MQISGVVNLFALIQLPGRGTGSLTSSYPSGGQGWECDLLPDLASFPQFLTVGGRGRPMAARTEMLRNGVIGREEPLGMPW